MHPSTNTTHNMMASTAKYLIGEGSFGKVYRFRYDKQYYAVKKIHRDQKNHPQLIQRIQAEGRIMKKASQHRNFVQFHGQIAEGRCQYLLAQFVPDGDLRSIDFLPSEQDLWEVIMQMAMALDHLRTNKIIHRDIKPENILLKWNHHDQDSQIVLKLTDFGLSEDVSEKDQELTEGIAGSPVFLAPQMCLHKPYSYEVDMWSLGITLFQLTNHQKCPYNDEIQEYMAKHKYNPKEKEMFEFLVKLITNKQLLCSSPYLEINKLVESMLNKNPAKRPTPRQILQNKKVVERLKLFNKHIKNRLFEGRPLPQLYKTINQKQNFKRNPNQQLNPQNYGQRKFSGQSFEFMKYSRSPMPSIHGEEQSKQQDKAKNRMERMKHHGFEPTYQQNSLYQILSLQFSSGE